LYLLLNFDSKGFSQQKYWAEPAGLSDIGCNEA
jgi:hypothetical protein